jgi:anaerobic C4-dicarboxylate transporter
MGRFIVSVLSLWVTGLISAAAALVLVLALFYLTYLVLSAAISLKGLVPLALAIGWFLVWRQERSGN